MRCAFGLVLVTLLLNGCGRIPLTWEDVSDGSVVQVEPNSTSAGVPFRVQDDGVSAIAITGRNIPPGAVVFWNERAVKTTDREDRAWLSASIPDDLYRAAGTNTISVRTSGGGRIPKPLQFIVYARTGGPPKISGLYPASAVAGTGFNVQPNGDSALGVAGKEFLPGVTVYLDGAPMRTVFGASGSISAAIPVGLVNQAGRHEIWTVNPDGKASARVELKITGN